MIISVKKIFHSSCMAKSISCLYLRYMTKFIENDVKLYIIHPKNKLGQYGESTNTEKKN